MRFILLLLSLLYARIAAAQSDSLFADSVLIGMNIPSFNDDSDDSESSGGQQDISSLLQSSRDPFNQFAGFQFGALRYRLRGLNGRNTQVLVNGLCMNNPETGLAAWSSWGGLNDVMRFPETRTGITSSRSVFSGAGGYAAFDSRAALFKKGKRFTTSAGNRVYNGRLIASIFSGLTMRNWAFAASASVRYGHQVFIPGTYFQGQAFYFSAEKLLSHKHSLAMTAFYSPLQQARTAASTLETFSLAGTNYYNSNWGYQQGKVRSASVSSQNKPVLMLTETIVLKNNQKLQNNLYYSFGRTSQSGLTWNDAENPDPDYYRYLPSYYLLQGDTAPATALTNQWQSSSGGQQVNWDHMILANKRNLYTDPTLLGQGSNTTETRARYILEDRVDRISHLALNSLLNKRTGRHFYSASARLEKYDARKFKEVRDLLGASYWLDVDQFADNLGVEEYLKQNDLDNPNKKVKTGDRFGYDYFLHISRAELFAQDEFNGRRFDYYFAAGLQMTKLWREGMVANGKFPGNSKGNSQRLNFICPQAKAGLTYKASGRQFLTAAWIFQSRMPDANNLFISAKTRNDIIPSVKNEKLQSAEISWHLKYPAFRARLTFFQNYQWDQTWLRTYWSDIYNTNINLIMTGIAQKTCGFEMGFEKIIRVSHLFQFAAGYMQQVFDSRPQLQAWQDNTGQQLFADRKVYLRNYYVGGAPQLVIGTGYRYNSSRYWFAGLNVNYVSEYYVEPNPDRRTAEAVQRFSDADAAQVSLITAQERLPQVFLVNAMAGKSYRFRKKYALNASISFNNLLNNRRIPVSGFESLRWDATQVQAFPNKYTYLQGFNFMLNCSLSF